MNLTTVNTTMENLSHTINNLFTGCSVLGELFSLESGVSLLNHYYIEPALPTSHRIKVQPYKSKGTLEDYARAIKLMLPRSLTFTTNLLYPRTTQEFVPILYAVNNIPTDTSNPDVAITYDTKSRYQPDILLWSPWSTGISSMYHPITNGIHIETSNIDGMKVPQPNINDSIFNENSHVLNSAMPFTAIKCMRQVYSSIRIDERGSTEPNTHKVSVSLYDLSIARYPLFKQTVLGTLPTSNLPGFSSIDNPRYSRLNYSRLSFTRTFVCTPDIPKKKPNNKLASKPTKDTKP